MKLLVFISCVLATAEFSAGGKHPHCNTTCDCKDRTCMGNGISVCRLFEEGELAGEKHCDCKLCEDDSSDDDSDSDVGDRRKRSFCIVCKTDCDCKNWTCPDDEIAYCKKEKNPQGDRICDCKSCVGESGDDDSDDDDDDDE